MAKINKNQGNSTFFEGLFNSLGSTDLSDPTQDEKINEGLLEKTGELVSSFGTLFEPIPKKLNAFWENPLKGTSKIPVTDMREISTASDPKELARLFCQDFLQGEDTDPALEEIIEEIMGLMVQALGTTSSEAKKLLAEAQAILDLEGGRFAPLVCERLALQISRLKLESLSEWSPDSDYEDLSEELESHKRAWGGLQSPSSKPHIKRLLADLSQMEDQLILEDPRRVDSADLHYAALALSRDQMRAQSQVNAALHILGFPIASQLETYQQHLYTQGSLYENFLTEQIDLKRKALVQDVAVSTLTREFHYTKQAPDTPEIKYLLFVRKRVQAELKVLAEVDLSAPDAQEKLLAFAPLIDQHQSQMLQGTLKEAFNTSQALPVGEAHLELSALKRRIAALSQDSLKNPISGTEYWVIYRRLRQHGLGREIENRLHTLAQSEHFLVYFDSSDDDELLASYYQARGFEDRGENLKATSILKDLAPLEKGLSRRYAWSTASSFIANLGLIATSGFISQAVRSFSVGFLESSGMGELWSSRAGLATASTSFWAAHRFLERSMLGEGFFKPGMSLQEKYLESFAEIIVTAVTLHYLGLAQKKYMAQSPIFQRAQQEAIAQISQKFASGELKSQQISQEMIRQAVQEALKNNRALYMQFTAGSIRSELLALSKLGFAQGGVSRLVTSQEEEFLSRLEEALAAGYGQGFSPKALSENLAFIGGLRAFHGIKAEQQKSFMAWLAESGEKSASFFDGPGGPGGPAPALAGPSGHRVELPKSLLPLLEQAKQGLEKDPGIFAVAEKKGSLTKSYADYLKHREGDSGHSQAEFQLARSLVQALNLGIHENDLIHDPVLKYLWTWMLKDLKDLRKSAIAERNENSNKILQVFGIQNLVNSLMRPSLNHKVIQEFMARLGSFKGDLEKFSQEIHNELQEVCGGQIEWLPSQVDIKKMLLRNLSLKNGASLDISLFSERLKKAADYYKSKIKTSSSIIERGSSNVAENLENYLNKYAGSTYSQLNSQQKKQVQRLVYFNFLFSDEYRLELFIKYHIREYANDLITALIATTQGATVSLNQLLQEAEIQSALQNVVGWESLTEDKKQACFLKIFQHMELGDGVTIYKDKAVFNSTRGRKSLINEIASNINRPIEGSSDCEFSLQYQVYVKLVRSYLEKPLEGFELSSYQKETFAKAILIVVGFEGRSRPEALQAIQDYVSQNMPAIKAYVVSSLTGRGERSTLPYAYAKDLSLTPGEVAAVSSLAKPKISRYYPPALELLNEIETKKGFLKKLDELKRQLTALDKAQLFQDLSLATWKETGTKKVFWKLYELHQTLLQKAERASPGAENPYRFLLSPEDHTGARSKRTQFLEAAKMAEEVAHMLTGLSFKEINVRE